MTGCDGCTEKEERLRLLRKEHERLKEAFLSSNDLMVAHSNLLRDWMERATKYSRLLEENGISLPA